MLTRRHRECTCSTRQVCLNMEKQRPVHMTQFAGRPEPGLSLLVSQQETHKQQTEANAPHTPMYQHHGFLRTTVFEVMLRY